SALRPALNCGHGNKGQSLSHIHQQVSVDELIGKKGAIFVVEYGFEFVGSRCGIDLIVDRQQFTAGDFISVVTVKCINFKLNAFAKLVVNRRKLVLRQGENNGDRLHLRDDNQATRIGRVNNVAGIDKAQTNAAGNRRSDAAISKLKL